MEVGTQQLTRVQKKRQKMAAKKEAKKNGMPVPKAPRVYRPHRKKAEPQRPAVEQKPKTTAPLIARTHIELRRLIQQENELQLTPDDINYPEKPAYTMEFFVPNNTKTFDATIEFPEENVTFLNPKKSCPELFKMLSGIGMKATVAKFETRLEGPKHLKGLRIFINEKAKSFTLHYAKPNELPNVFTTGGVRTMNAPLVLDIILSHQDTIMLYLTSINGESVSLVSCTLNDDMVDFDYQAGTFTLAKDIMYSLRCGLCVYLEGKFTEIAKEYFENMQAAVYLPQRILG